MRFITKSPLFLKAVFSWSKERREESGGLASRMDGTGDVVALVSVGKSELKFNQSLASHVLAVREIRFEFLSHWMQRRKIN